MAYGNVVGYEPVEGAEGAYRFSMADGSSMPVMGAAAADLKARVDAADAATAATRTAQNMSLPEGGAGGEGGMSMADAGGAPAQAEAPLPQPDVNMSVDPGANQSVQPAANMSPNPGAAPAAPAQAAPAAAPYTVGGVDVGLIKGPDGALYERTAGSAGDPGGLKLRTQTEAGGFDASQEYIEKQNELNLRKQAAVEVGLQAAQEQAAAQKSFIEEQQRQQVAEMAELQKREADVQKGVGDLESKYAAAQKEYASAPPPKDSRSTLGVILGVLGSALGAYGAAITKSPNFAMQLVNKMVDDDIRSQETALAVKKDKANNALGDLQRKMGSLELAKSAVRGIRLQQAKTEYDRIAATSADAQVRAGALEMSARLDQEHANTLEDYRLKGLGQVTKSYVNTPKVAATAPGVRRLGTKAAIGLVKDAAGLDSSAAGTAKTLSSIKPGGAGSLGAEAQKEAAGIEAALAGLAQFEAAHAKAGSPGVLNTGVGGSDASKELGAAANALGPLIGRGLEGNAPNDSTMKDIKGNLLSASGEKITKSVAQYRQQLQNRLKSIRESGGGAAPEPAPPAGE